jgi:hypothetical protein
MNTISSPSTSTNALAPASAGRTVPGEEIAHLYRVRTGVRAVLALGVAASVAANVLHAEPTIVGRVIGAWSPLALLLTVELISRVPAHRLVLSVLRMIATGLIAGIAAWVSYWHMVAVVTRTGESVTSAHLLPLSVDGLVVVASVSLVEIAARLRHASTPDTAPAEAVPSGLTVVTDPDTPEHEAETGPVPAPRPAPRVTATRRPGRPVARSAASTVTRLRDKHPDWTVGQIADKAGVAERTVRRHLNAATAAVAVPTAAAADPPDSAGIAA